MEDIVCLSIDAESESGRLVAERYGARRFPALLFLNADGSPRDLIAGYMPTDPFHEEIKRIKSGEGTIPALRETIARDPWNLDVRFELHKKLLSFNVEQELAEVRAQIEELVLAGQGYNLHDVDSIYGLYKNLLAIGMTELARSQVPLMEGLDPEGKSLGLRRLALDRLLEEVRRPADLHRVVAFLQNEVHDQVLFDAWYAIYSVNDRAARKTRKRAEHRALRLAAREAAVVLWSYTPEQYHGKLGNLIAWGFYEDRAELTPPEVAFALKVAEVAVVASDQEIIVIDTYACCLFIAGHVEKAIRQIDVCIQLDPENRIWLDRRKLFTGGKR